ncbi:MAG: hypothetical protein MIO93_16955 [ANME-2 cluster archaeon]|jgi:hypothetical protein|nr:hypothetical protein [ANME-2 cluster archaeon]
MKFKIAGIGIVSILCYISIFTLCVSAIGIGVNPAKLELEIENGESIQKNITISNPDNIEFAFHIYTDDEFNNWITIADPDFSLGPYQEKEIYIHFTPLTEKVGTFNTTIYAVALNPNNNLNLGSGVKIPVNINLKKPTTSYYTNPVFIVFILIPLILIFLYMRYRRNSL